MHYVVQDRPFPGLMNLDIALFSFKQAVEFLGDKTGCSVGWIDRDKNHWWIQGFRDESDNAEQDDKEKTP